MKTTKEIAIERCAIFLADRVSASSGMFRDTRDTAQVMADVGLTEKAIQALLTAEMAKLPDNPA